MVNKAQKEAPRMLAACLPSIVPELTPCMTDTKKEVKKAAKKAMEGALKVAGNKDIEPVLADLVDCIISPSRVPELMHKLGGVVFVQTIDSPRGSPAVAPRPPPLAPGPLYPRVVGWHAEVQVVRVLQGRRDAQPQLLHVRVEHVRLKVELVQALECVASVALHDGHDHALLAGQHGVPELGQERVVNQVDVVGERLQLKTFAALEEAVLLWWPKGTPRRCR